MRSYAALLTLLLAACAPGQIDGNQAPANPAGPDIRTPPPSDTADDPTGCDAVTAAGTCEGQQAVFCDVDADVVRRIDCQASGQTCEVDPARGAGCASATPPEPPAQDDCGAVSFYGECSGSIARWCEGGAIKEIDCAAAQLTCGTEVCFEGAACCTAAQVQMECQTLGVYGACGGASGTTVRWCDLAGTIHALECVGGQTCQLDACGTGAQCC